VLIWCAAMAQDSLDNDPGHTPVDHVRHGSASEGWTVLSHLLTGIFVFGAVGWGLDQLFGTRWFLLIGLLLGGAASFALIYIRYVYIPPDPFPRPGDAAGPMDRKEQHG
jgi:F0F1-type ATP synthase assembly protein I